jgi:oligoendopeptidase F
MMRDAFNRRHLRDKFLPAAESRRAPKAPDKDSPKALPNDTPQDSTGAAANQNLPRWNLADLYPGLDSKELARDKAEVEQRAAAFAEAYEGRIPYLTGPDLAGAVEEYESISETLNTIQCYTILMEADNLNNFAKTAELKRWQGEAAGKISFFEDAICAMKERDLMTKLATPELASYGPWFARVRVNASALPEGVEEMSGEFRSINREAWGRLYAESLSAIRVDMGGRRLTLDEADDAIGESKSLDERKALRAQVGETLKANAKRMALIYNTIVKDDLIDTELRGRTRPDEAENTANALTGEIVDTMHATVKGSYEKLSHRYYAWKAKQHGTEVMPRAQVGMALPGEGKEEREYDFAEARRIILRAFKKFSPRFERTAKKFFDEKHIDAQPRPDKETGAFSLATGPGNLPYVFLSYTDSIDDLVTLGHELGHGVHQALAEKARGLFLSEMSTTVSETASIFAEMLVFEELLRGEKDPAARKKLLADKTEGMILNGLQQLSYYDFEKRVHEERKKGELSAERISDIWVETQKQYFGPAVELDTYDRYYWTVVPHFFDTPFYVYSYSFAQVLVSGLYQTYKGAEKEGQAAKEEFVQNYIGLLETGITRNFYEMFQPFGLDPETPEFWQQGLSLIDKYLTDLEKSDQAPAVQPAVKKPAAPKRPAR